MALSTICHCSQRNFADVSTHCLHIVYTKVDRIKVYRNIASYFLSYIAFAAIHPLFGLA